MVKKDLLKAVRGDGSWSFREAASGILECWRENSYSQRTVATDALGPYWLLGVGEIVKGSALFGRDFALAAGDRYLLYCSPFSLMRTEWTRSQHRLHCFVSRAKAPSEASGSFACKWTGRIEIDLGEMTARLESSDLTDVSTNRSPSAAAAKIKRALDREFLSVKSLSEIAEDVSMSSTLFGRRFKQEFGVTPLAYRNQLRIANGSFELLAGKSVTETFTEVGFEDLGRFIKQFKRVTGATPKAFRTSKNKSKNAK